MILLADRGFVHTQLMTMLTAQLGWHYRIQIKSNTWIWRGKWCQPKSFHLGCGEAICLHEVVVRGKRRWVDIHWFRSNSYFRISWDWIQAALVNGWKLIYSVTFSSHHDPKQRSHHLNNINNDFIN